jgi:hypothetical protein
MVKGGQHSCCCHINSRLHKFPGVCLAFFAPVIDEGFGLGLDDRFFTIAHKNSFLGVSYEWVIGYLRKVVDGDLHRYGPLG